MMVKYLRDVVTAPFPTVEKPLWHHERGLSETASGYGARLTSRRVLILPDGSERRIYITQWANAGTAWINYRGERYVVSDCDIQ